MYRPLTHLLFSASLTAHFLTYCPPPYLMTSASLTAPVLHLMTSALFTDICLICCLIRDNCLITNEKLKFLRWWSFQESLHWGPEVSNYASGCGSRVIGVCIVVKSTASYPLQQLFWSRSHTNRSVVGIDSHRNEHSYC